MNLCYRYVDPDFPDLGQGGKITEARNPGRIRVRRSACSKCTTYACVLFLWFEHMLVFRNGYLYPCLILLICVLGLCKIRHC